MPDNPTPADSPAWDDDALADPHRRADKATRVRAMFNAIAPTYERINTLATFGRDAAWRRRAVREAAVEPDDVVLDVACGTGDMIRTFAVGETRPQRIIGVDFAGEMLARGDYAGIEIPIELLKGDALDLPLPESSVDVISCAFGVRNFQDLGRGLSEMGRVARRGARVVILEFATPENPLLRWAYQTYCRVVLPTVAALVSRDKTRAYRYLPKSIETFTPRGAFIRLLEQAGFGRVCAISMNLGGVVIYRGERVRT